MNPCFRRWQLLGSSVMALALCACSAEPPPAEAATQSPLLHSMLQQMGNLAVRGNGEQRHVYTLAKNCNLHATKLLNGQPIKRMFFSLAEARFGRYDYAPGLGYAVRTVNQEGEIDNVVFDAPALESILSMLQLLEKIKLECLKDSVAGDRGKPNDSAS